MKGFLALVLVALLGWAGYWYVTEARRQEAVQKAEEDLVKDAVRLTETIQEKLKNSSLRADDIRDELAKTGKVVRRIAREVGVAAAEATADARITAAIKAKLVTDSDLSALSLSISVNTTYGVVTYSGLVRSYDDIGRAVLLALETDGVREVISTLQLRQSK